MERLGRFLCGLTHRWMPDPFVVACGLTLIVFAAVVFFPMRSETPPPAPSRTSAGIVAGGLPNQDASDHQSTRPGGRDAGATTNATTSGKGSRGVSGPLESGLTHRAVVAIGWWFDGLWSTDFLAFALQMCLMLLAGYGIAQSPPVLRGFRAIALRIPGNRSAVCIVSAVSCVGCLINWGFGLVAAGTLARELGKVMRSRGIRVQYALTVAGAYSGMMIWHGGLSGSAPLRVAGKGVVLAAYSSAEIAAPGADDQGRALDTLDLSDDRQSNVIAPIPVSRTLFSRQNLAVGIVFVVGIPFVLGRMASNPSQPAELESPRCPEVTAESADCGSSDPLPGNSPSPADRLNQSRWFSWVVAALMIGGLWSEIARSGVGAITLNWVNLTFIAMGVLLHRNLADFLAAVQQGGGAIVGIVVQFPLYAGLQKLMSESGWAAEISGSFVTWAIGAANWTGLPIAMTFPVFVLLSAGLLNLFVPSGGGQWIVQGPIVCAAARSLGLPYEQAIMAVSYGDGWTNMMQPFWALPVMGLTGAAVRDFMGYCMVLLFIGGPIMALGLMLLG